MQKLYDWLYDFLSKRYIQEKKDKQLKDIERFKDFWQCTCSPTDL